MTVRCTSSSKKLNLVLLGILLLSSFNGVILASDLYSTEVTIDESDASCKVENTTEQGSEEDMKLVKKAALDAILSFSPETMDPTLSPILTELKNRKAHLCWHKHSSFYEHLVNVHNILRLWVQGRDVALVGMLHSAYSNSYVNLALFDPVRERDVMQKLIGTRAEEDVYMFCSFDRQRVVVETLLKDGVIPKNGLDVEHLHTKQPMHLSPELLRELLIFSLADTADQYFGWQDDLFGMDMFVPNTTSDMNSKTLWPGLSRPGVFLFYLSQLCSVASTYSGNHTVSPLPPVFEGCTRTISREDEIRARDLYWDVMLSSQSTSDNEDDTEIIEMLEECISLNPFVAEPLVLLSQKYHHIGDIEKARDSAKRASDIQAMWGTAWDKRMSFGAWVAWTKVMLLQAEEGKPWPENSWEVNGWGLVSSDD